MRRGRSSLRADPAAAVGFGFTHSWRARAQDESLLMSLVQRHLKYTGSTVARGLLNNWSMARAAFVKVFPVEYRRAGAAGGRAGAPAAQGACASRGRPARARTVLPGEQADLAGRQASVWELC